MPHHDNTSQSNHRAAVDQICNALDVCIRFVNYFFLFGSSGRCLLTTVSCVCVCVCVRITCQCVERCVKLQAVVREVLSSVMADGDCLSPFVPGLTEQRFMAFTCSLALVQAWCGLCTAQPDILMRVISPLLQCFTRPSYTRIR